MMLLFVVLRAKLRWMLEMSYKFTLPNLMVRWNSLHATVSNKDCHQGFFHQFRSIEFCYENKAIAQNKDVNRDEQNRRFCCPTSQLILMLGILIGGRFWDFKCLIWNFLIWKQQNLHIKENDQHLVQLLPNKLVTPFIIVLLVSINVFDFSWQRMCQIEEGIKSTQFRHVFRTWCLSFIHFHRRIN